MSHTTGLVLTHNEENMLPACLDSLSWCEDLIVVDAGSTDRTKQVAKNYGARVVVADPVPEKKPVDIDCRLGIEKAETEYILRIDADERITPEVKKRIQDIVDSKAADIAFLPRKNIIAGKWVKGAGQWPDYTPHLFNQSKLSISDRLHQWWEIDSDAEVHYLPPNESLAVVHYRASSLSEFIRAQRRYAVIEGSQTKFSYKRLLLGGPCSFYTHFVRKRGWRDGVRGLAVSISWSIFQLESMIHAKKELIGRYD